MSEVLEVPICPRCSSENLRKDGKNKDSRQIYRCRDCNRKFVFPTLTRVYREENKKYFETEKLPLFDYAKIKELYVRQTVDSIASVPCFCCPDQIRCSSESCTRLEKWCWEND